MTTWPILAGLTDAERAEVLTLAVPRRYATGDVVCSVGEASDSLHLVDAGALAVRVIFESGDIVTINVLGPGDSFGELALLRDGRRTATVVALEASVTRAVPASAFRRLCEDRPVVLRTLASMLADRVEELSERLLEATYASVEQRIVRRLAALADLYAVRGGVITIPLTQLQLAELAGVTRQSVNEVLGRLADEGVVLLARGRVEVHDRSRLTGPD